MCFRLYNLTELGIDQDCPPLVVPIELNISCNSLRPTATASPEGIRNYTVGLVFLWATVLVCSVTVAVKALMCYIIHQADRPHVPPPSSPPAYWLAVIPDPHPPFHRSNDQRFHHSSEHVSLTEYTAPHVPPHLPGPPSEEVLSEIEPTRPLPISMLILHRYLFLLAVLEIVNNVLYGGHKMIELALSLNVLVLPSVWSLELTYFLHEVLSVLNQTLFGMKRWWVALMALTRCRIIMQKDVFPGRTVGERRNRCWNAMAWQQRCTLVALLLGFLSLNVTGLLRKWSQNLPMCKYKVLTQDCASTIEANVTYCQAFREGRMDAVECVKNLPENYLYELPDSFNRTFIDVALNMFDLTLVTLAPFTCILVSSCLSWISIVQRARRPYHRFWMAFTVLTLFLTSESLLEIPLTGVHTYNTVRDLKQGPHTPPDLPMQVTEFLSATKGIFSAAIFILGDSSLRCIFLRMFSRSSSGDVARRNDTPSTSVPPTSGEVHATNIPAGSSSWRQCICSSCASLSSEEEHQMTTTHTSQLLRREFATREDISTDDAIPLTHHTGDNVKEVFSSKSPEESSAVKTTQL